MIVREYRMAVSGVDRSLQETHVQRVAEVLQIPWVKEKGGKTLLNDEYVTDAKGYLIAVIWPDPPPAEPEPAEPATHQ